jgi:hypothetical protein
VGVKPMSIHPGKQIESEPRETERSPNRQAMKAISIMVFPQTSEGQYDPRHKSGPELCRRIFIMSTNYLKRDVFLCLSHIMFRLTG